MEEGKAIPLHAKRVVPLPNTMEEDNLINQEIKKKFELNKEYSIQQIIKVLLNFDPILVKSVITQGITNDNYIISKYKIPFTKSIIKIVSHQQIQSRIVQNKSIKPNLALSIPPFHKSTIQISLNNQNTSFVSLYDLFLEIIYDAKKSIKVCSPFFDLSGLMELQNLLIKKANEDVKIYVLTRELNGGSEDDSIRKKSLRKFRERLVTEKLKKNISFRNYHFEDSNKVVLSSVHAKFLISDNLKAYFGSGEVRNNSFKKNFEMGIKIEEKEFVRQLSIVFDILYSIAKEI